jgi:hypothetical protein
MKYALILIVLVASFLLQGHPNIIMLVTLGCCSHLLLHALLGGLARGGEKKE